MNATPGAPPTDLAWLRAWPLCAELPEDALRALSEHLRRYALPARTVIFQQGQPGDELFVLASGRVLVYVAGVSGRELWVDLLAPGEVFGEIALLDDQPHPASARSLTGIELLALGRADFHRLLRASPVAGLQLLRVLAARLRHGTAFAAELALNDLAGQMARVLLNLAERHGQHGGDGLTLDLGLTQAELARMTGSTRESVNRVLGAYRNQGLVAVDGRRLTLRQPEALARLTTQAGMDQQL